METRDEMDETGKDVNGDTVEPAQYSNRLAVKVYGTYKPAGV